MSAALAALKKVQTALGSARSSSDKKKASASSDSNETQKSVTAPYGWPEPGPLGRSAETGGCRLPQLDSIASAWEARRGSEQHEIDASTSDKLAADLARPFGQSTGRGFSLTRFRTHGSYNTVTMRQRDVWSPWMGPGHTATLRTLYEIGHVITRADPICGHLRWAEEYPFLVPNMANFGLDQRFSEEEARRITTFSLPITALDSETAPLLPGNVPMHKRLQCGLFHRVDCMCPDSIAFGALHVFGHPLSNTNTLTNLRKCCPRCNTDYTVNISPDATPGRPDGRLLVFTTWKCLGNGTERSHYWQAHATPAKPDRCYGSGHPHWTFEAGASHPVTHKIDVAEIQRCIASARWSPTEAPPEYAAVAEPGSCVI